MSKYFEIEEINIEENYATIWHTILQEEIKVIFDLDTFSEKQEQYEGGCIVDTCWVDIPMIEIIDTMTFNADLDEWQFDNLNWKSNTYIHQDKIDFIAELENQLYEMLNF